MISDTFLCKHSPRRTGNIQNAVKKLQGINCCMRRTYSQGIPVNMKVAVVVCALGLLASCVGGTSQRPCLQHADSSVAFLFICHSIRTMGFSALQACRGLGCQSHAPCRTAGWHLSFFVYAARPFRIGQSGRGSCHAR